MRLVEFIPRVTTGDDSANAVSNPHNVKPIVHYVDTIKDCFTAPVYDELQTIIPPGQSDWKERALRDLDAFKDKSIWAATYLRCGSCYKGFVEWLSENPVDENWGEKAREIILEKKWL